MSSTILRDEILEVCRDNCFLARFPLAVGVTGHRSLSAEQLPRIREQIGEILIDMRDAAEKISDFYNRKADVFPLPPLLSAVSCMSEGTDRLFADIAATNGYRIEAVLPFPASSPVNAMDLTGEEKAESLAEFSRIRELAKGHVLTLPDIIPEQWRSLPALKDKDFITSLSDEAEALRQKAYAEAGVRMLENCDVLISVWRGGMQLAEGSTFATMTAALERGIPVVIIDAAENCAPRTVLRAEDIFRRDMQDVGIREILLQKFGCASMNDPQSPSGDVFAMQLRMEAESLLQGNRARGPVPAAMRKMAGYWKRFENSFKGKYYPKNLDLASQLAGQKLTDEPSEYRESNDTLFRVLDKAATLNAEMYRASFLSVAAGGLAATLFSAVSVLLSETAYQSAFTAVFGGAASASLLVTLFVASNNKKNGWQQKLTSFRYMAEWLRMQEYARSAGISCRGGFADSNGYGDKADFILRCAMREYGVPNVDLSDPAYIEQLKNSFRSALIESQKQYHAVNAAKYYRLNSFFCNFGDKMFFVSLLAGIMSTLSAVCFLQIPFLEPLIFIGTVGPAIAIAGNSVGQYAEARRLFKKSARMAGALQQLSKELDECGNDAYRLRKVIQRSVDLMLEDTVDWKTQYGVAELSA